MSALKTYEELGREVVAIYLHGQRTPDYRGFAPVQHCDRLFKAVTKLLLQQGVQVKRRDATETKKRMILYYVVWAIVAAIFLAITWQSIK